MGKIKFLIITVFIFILFYGCETKYKIKPMSFKMPDSYTNNVNIDGAKIAAKAFVGEEESSKAFGFNVRKAGMLPVQVVFDNQSRHIFKIVAGQSFLEDNDGNLWPVLDGRIAHDRATKYATSGKIIEEGVYHGFWGAAAGSIIGAAIGIVTGDNVAAAAGKGAALGAAAGAVMGGANTYETNDPNRKIIDDFKERSFGNRKITPNIIAHGFLFFPGEAESAKKLRLHLISETTQKAYVLTFSL